MNGDARARARRASSRTRTARRSRSPACSSRCTTRPASRACASRRTRPSPARARSGWSELRAEPPAEHDLAIDWDLEGDETDEESKIRAETRKILELPDLPISATSVRVPVLVGHAQAVWVETEEPLSAERRARRCSAARPASGSSDFPTPRAAAQTDDVLVGRIRRDPTARTASSLPRRRQPPQGRRAERDPDRRAPARAASRRGLSFWLWLLVFAAACAACWLALVLLTGWFRGRRTRTRATRALSSGLPRALQAIARRPARRTAPRRSHLA